MTAPGGMNDGLAAALIQISAHAERIGSLDAREAAHFEDISSRVRTLASEVADDVAGKQAILTSLNDLDTQVAALAPRLADTAETEQDAGIRQYPVGGSPRWWKQTGPEQEHALARLRSWVEQIYRPGYGQLAAILPACWERHPACLYTLDWLSELWSVLYLAPGPRRPHPRRPSRMAHPPPARRRQPDGHRSNRLPPHPRPIRRHSVATGCARRADKYSR
jgi:hypothetical protein